MAHKYGAVATVVDGHKFPSKKEANRYGELKLLQQAGKIQRLHLQPKFELTVNGIIIGKYIADFDYWENGVWVVEDAKGFKTPLYKWKRKHCEAEHGIKIVEV